MNLEKLFEAQRLLDKRIEKEHPLTYDENRIAKKILALQVELGEMANECPDVFKFWSNKVRNQAKALEEAVDVLHFILSIGNEMNFDKEYFSVYVITPETLEGFGDMFYKISRFESEGKAGDYYRMLDSFVNLTHSLKFTWEEIETAYYEKNQINHQRQQEGY